MSKFYFKCPVHGPISMQEVREDFVHLGCGEKVEQNNEAWEKEPMSEKMRAFLFVSGVAFAAITLAVVIRRIWGA